MPADDVEGTSLINNCIQQGIKQSIEITHQNKCERASLILIYSGIDTMAFLDMPVTQTEAGRDDFIKWADQYISVTHYRERLTGIDLYGARCGLLHQYGVESKLSRDGKCRMLGYMDPSGIPILRDSRHPDLLMVSITALKHAFFAGIDKFIADAFADADKRKIVTERMRKFLVHYDVIDYSKASPSSGFMTPDGLSPKMAR